MTQNLTPKLGLSVYAAGDEGWDVGVNENFSRLDSVVKRDFATNRDTTTFEAGFAYGYYGGTIWNGETGITSVPSGTLPLPANSVCYVMRTIGGGVSFSVGGWQPDKVPMAIVTTGPTGILTVEDVRPVTPSVPDAGVVPVSVAGLVATNVETALLELQQSKSPNGHGHSNATQTQPGFMSGPDKTKLDASFNYTHPSADGSHHVPATSTTNNTKVLKSGATAGSEAWGFVAFSELTGKPATYLATAHAASHMNGGADEISTPTAAANAIPKANASGKLLQAWLYGFTGSSQSGIVSATAGDSTKYLMGDGTWDVPLTTKVLEGTNLYFTEARVRNTALTGLSYASSATILATDTLLGGLGKAQGQITALGSSKEAFLTAGTSAQFYRGDKTWQTLNTAAVPELTNLYFTQPRAVSSLLAGYTVPAASAVAAGDSILQAIGKLEAQVATKQGNIAYTTANKAGETFTGGVTVAPSAVLGEVLALKAGSSADHAFMALYARSATPSVRSAYTGFGSAGDTTLKLKNELSGGGLDLQTTGGGRVYANGAEIWSTANFDPTTKEGTLTAGTTAQYYKGNKTWATLDTAAVAENVANLYFTNARVVVAPLAGYSAGTNTLLAAADTIVGAFGKVQGQITNLGSTKQNNIGYTPVNQAGDTLTGTLYGPRFQAKAASTATGFSASITGDGNSRVAINTDGSINFSDGTAAQDTTLVRSGVGTMSINGNGIWHAGNFTPSSKQDSITAGTGTQYWRGDKTWQTLDTTAVAEGTGKYFTEARVLASVLADFSAATATAITSADSVVVGIGKAQGQVNAVNTLLSAGTSAKYLRGDKTWTVPSTTEITEGTNLYFTNARVDSRLATLKGAANGIASLDANGKLVVGQVPAVAINDTFVCTSQAQQLALTAQRGDICIRTDLNCSYVLSTDSPSTLGDWVALLAVNGSSQVSSVNTKIGTVVLNADDIAPTATRLWMPATGIQGQVLDTFAVAGASAAVTAADTVASAFGKVQKQINTIGVNSYLPLGGGTLTGALLGTSFNGISGLASVVSPMNGTAAVGTGVTVARQDHVHATDTSRAPVWHTFWIGNSAISLNRTAEPLALQGITSIDGYAAGITGGLVNQIPVQTAANTTGFISAANYAVLATDGSGLPAMLAGASGVLTGSASAPPAWSTSPALSGSNFNSIPWSALPYTPLNLTGGVLTGALSLDSFAGTYRLSKGGVDATGAYTDANVLFEGWNSLAFKNSSAGGTYPSQISGYLDFREGVLAMKGGFRVGTNAVWHAGTFNPSTKEGTIAAGSAGQYFRHDKTWANLTSAVVTEATNLYYTDTRARAAHSATAPLTYNSTSGLFAITKADAATHGYLSMGDWATFNGKQAALGFTPINKAGDSAIGGHLSFDVTTEKRLLASGTNISWGLALTGTGMSLFDWQNSRTVLAYNAAANTLTTAVPFSSSTTVAASSFTGAGTGLTGTASSLTAGSASAVPWSGVGSKPTTLAGYGISDAAASGHTHAGVYASVAAPAFSGDVNAVGTSTSWGLTPTSGYRTIMGTSTAATWLSYGTSGGTLRGGIQLMDSGTTMRLYANTNFVQVDAAGMNYNGTALVLTNDSRLSDARTASDVYSWAKQASKPAYTAAEVGAATSGHTHAGTYQPVGSYVLTGDARLSDARPANGGTSAAVTINYSTGTNGNYQILWGGGSTLYGNGNIYCNPSTGQLSATSFYGGTVYSTGDIIAYYSDGRLKKNVEPIQNPIEKLKAIRGVTYQINDLALSLGIHDAGQQVGVIAQEVATVMPEVLAHAPFDMDRETGGSKSGEFYMTVKYERLVPLLIEAVKEQQTQLDGLKTQVAELLLLLNRK